MKKIFIHVVMAIILFSMPKVSALTSNVQIMPNVYYTMMISGDDFYYHSDGQGYTRLGGDIVYCIEPEKLIYNNKQYNKIETSSLNLTEEQINKINLIGHYGYDYYNHQNYRYYLAAQELIWYIVRPTFQMFWSTEIQAINFSDFYVDAEKNEILYLVENHLTKPYFDNQEIIVNIGEEMILTDDILKHYEVISNNESDVKIIDNKLIINKKGINEEEIKLKKKISYDDKEMAFYGSEGHQSVVLTRANIEVISTVKLKTVVGSVSIRKVDSKTNLMVGRNGATLKGTKYHLYDENMNLLKEIVLNEEVYKIDNLKVGTYKLKEIESGQGYKLDSNIYEFKISLDNLNPEIVLTNDIISTNLTIKKLYGSNQKIESNAEFEVIDSNGFIEKIVTNEDGIASINLEYGDYKIKQVKGIKNHLLIKPFDIEVRNDIPLEFNLINEEIKANLTINKIDSETKKIIKEEVIFKIFNLDTNTYLKIDSSEEFKTNNGVLKISDLSLGNYLLKEVKSPNGYLVSNDIKIELKEDMAIDFENTKEYKKIKINKEGENELLDGVIFDLFAKEDIIIDGVIYLKKDEFIDKEITNNEPNDNKKEDEEKEKPIIEKIDNDINNKENTKTIENKVKKEIQEIIKDKVININEELKKIEYIEIPNTGVREFKLSKFGALIIILMGYIILKYAKK